MGLKFQVIGGFPIARPGMEDALPADPAEGRMEGEIFDVEELDPRTLIKPLVSARLIKLVDDKATDKPADKAPGGKP